MNRRGFLLGLSAGIVAPTIVRAEALMPIKSYAEAWLPCDGRIINPRLYPELHALMKRAVDQFSGLPIRTPDLSKNPYPWLAMPNQQYVSYKILATNFPNIGPIGMMTLYLDNGNQ